MTNPQPQGGEIETRTKHRVSDKRLVNLIGGTHSDTTVEVLALDLRDARSDVERLTRELARVTAQRDNEVANRRADYKQIVEMSGGDSTIGSTMLLVKIKHRLAAAEEAREGLQRLVDAAPFFELAGTGIHIVLDDPDWFVSEITEFEHKRLSGPHPSPLAAYQSWTKAKGSE